MFSNLGKTVTIHTVHADLSCVEAAVVVVLLVAHLNLNKHIGTVIKLTLIKELK